jgi:sRNA-binding regulator protein Hfq
MSIYIDIHSLQVMGNTEDQNTCDQDATTTKSGGPPQFLPTLLKRAAIIWMMDGHPIKGKLEAYNNYDILLDLGQAKKLMVFKGNTASIDFKNKPPNDKPDIERC